MNILRVVRTSERYQCDILKILVKFSEFINDNLVYVQKKEQVIAFLNTKIKNKEEDPEEKWITTWNDYLNRLRLFYRWLYNHVNDTDHQNYQTPEFIKIKNKEKKEFQKIDSSVILIFIFYLLYLFHYMCILSVYLSVSPHLDISLYGGF